MKPYIFLALFGCSWLSQGLAHSVDTRYENATPIPKPYSEIAANPLPSGIKWLRPRLDLDTQAAAKAAIDAMNRAYYSSAEAIWSRPDPWWLSGVALTSVIDYMRKTGSNDYMDQVNHIIQVQRTQYSQNGGDFRAESTDDTGWWALAMIRMYDLTGNSAYLNISIADEAYMYKYWTSSPCGGGIYVDIKTKTYKNAIANELYIKLAASLHNRIANDTKYLTRAETAWSWFQRSGMIKNDNLISDGLASSSNGACYNNRLPVWTYNQGVILGALVELYRATSLETYLTSARSIADAVLSNDGTTNPQLTTNEGSGDGGVLTEASCRPDELAGGCNHDQQVFKGVLAYNLAELDDAVAAIDGSRPYRAYLERNAQSAYVNAREPNTDLYDVSWAAGPAFGNSTIGKQASAVGLLVAVF
ncbi:hypothetical protein VTI28DRAFT_10531 [Corynascus sepedonium]